jgi:hypothetical protein
MGTNFYWKDSKQTDGIQDHIGKRSAAGYYCWDCGTTLLQSGDRNIHYSEYEKNWLKFCPSCFAEIEKETITESSAGTELGFNKITGGKKGIKTCCSFTWTLMKHLWKIQNLCDNVNKEKVIINEYGDEFSAEEFLQMLKGCPVQYQYPNEFS